MVQQENIVSVNFSFRNSFSPPPVFFIKETDFPFSFQEPDFPPPPRSVPPPPNICFYFFYGSAFFPPPPQPRAYFNFHPPSFPTLTP
jgi:hypothetical protein